MKTALLAIVMFLGFVGNIVAADRLEKSALLSFPDEVSVKSPFRAEVEFRWDEDTPLTIATWSLKEGQSTFGEIRVFDESGKEIQMIFPVSMPLIANAQKIVRKGEVIKLRLYLMGWPLFERGGAYYAVATFSRAFREGTNVRFTTKKRWFRVGSRESNGA